MFFCPEAYRIRLLFFKVGCCGLSLGIYFVLLSQGIQDQVTLPSKLDGVAYRWVFTIKNYLDGFVRGHNAWLDCQ